MFEKAYKCRYRYVRAIQFDGTAEMALDLANEYHGIIEANGALYMDDITDAEIRETDWLILQNNRVKATLPNEWFHDIYSQISTDEFFEHMPAKDFITDVDLRDIDEAKG